ncbi:sorting nexin-31 isoform X2 [Ambystoma mexicanum]|uniref:sorting nexin-31 isoform X2 n=1 Tax=Ambystoma mexicanum TaxID=8296 RepID=UPI0037E97031
MHVTIPFTQDLVDSFGSRYVLYSLYLEGFLFCKVRYSDLHKWNEKLRRQFGKSVPPFPRKFYLAMTNSMAEERRFQLERYLQSVGANPIISSSELFVCYFKNLQMDTFGIEEQKANLDIYLPNGRKIRIDVQTSDSAERVLEIVAHKLDLHRELTGYFSVFVLQHHSTVLKRVVDFELPYVTLHGMNNGSLTLEVRKWYMDPSLDKVLFDSPASVTLLYLQALQEIDRRWARPTNEQLGKLESLEKSGNYTKFLELMQDVQQYGCIQLDLCTMDHPEPDCEVLVSVGNGELHCCVKLSNNTTKDIAFKVNMIRCWQVTFLGADLEDRKPPDDQKLELRFEYNAAGTWKWIVIYTKQAFLLSSCLKKMFSEELLKHTKDSLEMIEVPDFTKARTSSKSHRLVVPFGKSTERSKISPRSNINGPFPEITEEDL